MHSWFNFKVRIRSCGCQKSFHIDWKPYLVSFTTQYFGSELISVSLDLFRLGLKHAAKFLERFFIEVVHYFILNTFLQGLSTLGCIFALPLEEIKAVLEFLVVHFQERDRKILDMLSFQAVFSVDKLNHVVSRSPHGSIVFDLDIFERFNKSPLNIARFSCFDSSIDETFTSSHRMEVELCGLQTIHVAVGDETFTLSSEVIFTEMGERSSIEAKWNSLSVDVLLPYASHNLRDVDRTSLGPRGHHLSESVVWSQVLESTSSCLIQSFS